MPCGSQADIRLCRGSRCSHPMPEQNRRMQNRWFPDAELHQDREDWAATIHHLVEPVLRTLTSSLAGRHNDRDVHLLSEDMAEAARCRPSPIHCHEPKTFYYPPESVCRSMIHPGRTNPPPCHKETHRHPNTCHAGG